jgi:hypothetical protein
VNNNYNSNTVVKQDFAVVKQVDGLAAHMTNTTRHQSWQSTSPTTLVPEVYFYYFHCEGERKNKPLVESGN